MRHLRVIAPAQGARAEAAGCDHAERHRHRGFHRGLPRTENEAEGQAADAVTWDELVARTREESTLTVTFVMFLSPACLIAAIGAR